MYVRHLSVADFRSWPSAELALEPGATVLVGANGQGKTNLLEAVGYLATLGSHRVAADAPLVRAGTERAIVRGAVVSEDRELTLEVEITPGRANRARINGAPARRPRDLLGALRTVLFAPEDLAIIRGDPGERRGFLDELATTRAPRLAGVRADYDRILKQRAALLKSAGGRRGSGNSAPGELPTLDVWDGHLAETGAELLQARLTALQALRPFAVAAYRRVAPTSAPLTLAYQCSAGDALPELAQPELALSEFAGDDDRAAIPERARLRDGLLTALAGVRRAELERGVNLVGPHRDDLVLGLGTLPLRGYASHGEGWSAALSLRLGSFELLRDDALPGGDPVLLLDDVFAELDESRRAQLAEVAASAEQVIITAAVLGDVPGLLAGRRWTVSAGQVSRAA